MNALVLLVLDRSELTVLANYYFAHSEHDFLYLCPTIAAETKTHFPSVLFCISSVFRVALNFGLIVLAYLTIIYYQVI